MGEMIQPDDPTKIPVVRERDGSAFADSRDVAAFFQRQHKHVLEAIRNMHCSHQFMQSNFRPCFSKDLTGETTSHVEMTKSGFVFLVMGFTGERAAEFKERYINRFDAMERELLQRRADPVAMLNDPAALRGLLAGYAERVQSLQLKVGELEPKAKALDRIATGTEGSLCITDAAKALQVQPAVLFRWLRERSWIYRRPGGSSDLAYQSRIVTGYLEMKTTTVQRQDGTERIVAQVRVTPKGMARLSAEFEGASRLL